MPLGRQVVIWFFSSMVCAVGARCAHYLAARLSSSGADAGGQLAGSSSRALCPCCGRPLRQFAKTLFCGSCGHREA